MFRFCDAVYARRRGGKAERRRHAISIWNDRYNLWSGLIGGTFLMLAYFGMRPVAGAALPDRQIDRRRAG